MEYKIVGGNFPAVVCRLNAGETIMTESGGMSWMSPNMQMETTTGGGLKKMFGRMMSGDHAFLNRYTAKGGPGTIAFTSSFPGSIKAFRVGNGGGLIAQKSAFLAMEEGVRFETYLQKKLGAGLFGGEGFIMQKISGNGLVFLEIDGSVMEYDLQAGEELVVSTGFVAAMQDTCTMDVQQVRGVKNVLFGGESLFNTVVRGPGKVILQTMPVLELAGTLVPYLPSGN